MKVERYEIVKAIARSNGVVLKDRNFPILGCILLADGSAIASNTEITIEQKLGTQEGEGEIVLPMRAFDMIKNLPDGAIDITQDESYRVTIRQGKVKSSFASYPPQDFTLRKDRPIGDGTVLPGERLMAALSKVIFAVDDQSSKMPLRGVHIKASGMTLTVEATDGHILARDQIKLDLMTHIDVIIPKMTATTKDIAIPIRASSTVIREWCSSVPISFASAVMIIMGDGSTYEGILAMRTTSSHMMRRPSITSIGDIFPKIFFINKSTIYVRRIRCLNTKIRLPTPALSGSG